MLKDELTPCATRQQTHWDIGIFLYFSFYSVMPMLELTGWWSTPALPSSLGWLLRVNLRQERRRNISILPVGGVVGVVIRFGSNASLHPRWVNRFLFKRGHNYGSCYSSSSFTGWYSNGLFACDWEFFGSCQSCLSAERGSWYLGDRQYPRGFNPIFVQCQLSMHSYQRSPPWRVYRRWSGGWFG